MEQWLSAYLFQYRTCTIPQLGTLRIQEGLAVLDTAEKQITAPLPTITFTKGEGDVKELIQFISFHQQLTIEEAGNFLKSFSEAIQNLSGYDEISIPEAGSFYIDENEVLQFRNYALPLAFFQPVTADRVIRPNNIHSVTVGDLETTNEVMSEMLQHSAKIGRNYSWIWAAALALISAALISWYVIEFGLNNRFGNARHVEPSIESTLYISK